MSSNDNHSPPQWEYENEWKVEVEGGVEELGKQKVSCLVLSLFDPWTVLHE